VLDEAQPYELDIYIEKYNRLEKRSWEQARFISYIIAQVNSKKQLKPEDILKFDWDRDRENESNFRELNSAENRAKIIEQMKSIEAGMKNPSPPTLKKT